MPFPTTPEERDKFAEDLIRMKDLGLREREDLDARMEVNEAYYECRKPNWSIRYLPGAEIQHFPLTTPKIDQLCATVLTTLFSQDPVLTASLPKDTGDAANRLQRQIQFFIEDHLQEALDTTAPISCTCGLGLLYVDFEAIVEGYTALTPPRRVPSGKKIAYAGPQFTKVHPRDYVQWPASISEIPSAQMCGHRFYRQKRDIEQLQDVGRYIADDRPLQSGDHPANHDVAGDYSEGRIGEVHSDKDKEELVECWQFICRSTELSKGKKEEWYIATVAERDKRLLRLKPYKRSRPGYVDFRFLPREYGSFWPSRSIANDLQALQFQYNYIQNLLIYGSYMACFTALVTDGDLKKAQSIEPGKIISIPGATKNESLKVTFDPGALLQMLTQIERQADALTRVTQEATGQALAKEQTKYEASIRQAGSATGMSKFLQTFGRSLTDVAQILQELLYENYDLWTAAYPESTFVKLEELKLPVQWDIQGKTPDDMPQVRVQKYQQAYALAQMSMQRRAALRQPPIFDMDVLEKSIMNQLRLSNIGEIIVEDRPTGMGQALPVPGMEAGQEPTNGAVAGLSYGIGQPGPV